MSLHPVTRLRLGASSKFWSIPRLRLKWDTRWGQRWRIRSRHRRDNYVDNDANWRRPIRRHWIKFEQSRLRWWSRRHIWCCWLGKPRWIVRTNIHPLVCLALLRKQVRDDGSTRQPISGKGRTIPNIWTSEHLWSISNGKRLWECSSRAWISRTLNSIRVQLLWEW